MFINTNIYADLKIGELITWWGFNAEIHSDVSYLGVSITFLIFAFIQTY